MLVHLGNTVQNNDFCIDSSYTIRYTFGMKTAVSIPDDTFTQADQLAQELGISRSELYARALRELLQKRRDERITETLNRIYAKTPESKEERAFRQRAARRTLERSEW